MVVEVFFHRTGWGGAGNRGTGIKSKIIPIARWLSRRVLWLMRYDYERVLHELGLLQQRQDNNDDGNVSNDSESNVESYSSDEENDVVDDSDF